MKDHNTAIVTPSKDGYVIDVGAPVERFTNNAAPILLTERENNSRLRYESDYKKRHNVESFGTMQQLHSLASPTENKKYNNIIYQDKIHSGEIVRKPPNKQRDSSAVLIEERHVRRGQPDVVIRPLDKPSHTGRETVKLSKVALPIKNKRSIDYLNQIKRPSIMGSEFKSYPKSQIESMGKNKGKDRLVLADAPVSRTVDLPKAPRSFNGKDSLVLRHREYIGDVVSTGTTFNATSFATLLPGDPCSYPWLSKVASSFERFNWRKASVIYVPTCSSTTSGSVIIAYDTNIQRSIPTSKVQMLEYECSKRGSAWYQMAFECRGMQQNLFTAYGNNVLSDLQSAAQLGTAVDLKSYGAGQLFVGCDGIAEGTVGEVHLEFEIEFKDPALYTNPMVQTHLGIYEPTSSTEPLSGQCGTLTNSVNGIYASNIAIEPFTTATVIDSAIIFPDFPAGTYFAFADLVSTGTMSNCYLEASGTGVTNVDNGNATYSSVTAIWGHFTVTIPTQVTLTFNNVSNLKTGSGGSVNVVVVPYDPNLGVFSY